jgi:hypothetical protein
MKKPLPASDGSCNRTVEVAVRVADDEADSSTSSSLPPASPLKVPGHAALQDGDTAAAESPPPEPPPSPTSWIKLFRWDFQ